jgi:polyphenol oxidase
MHSRYLAIPEFEEAGAVHFFGLKASFQKPSGTSASFNGTRVMTAKQVHRDDVLVINGHGQDSEIHLAEDDALVTDQKGFFVGVYTADCLPILLMDPRKKVVAAIHAGWRGSLLGVAQKALERMIKTFQCAPEEVLGAIGPGIGVCCYEVGNIVLEPYSHDPELEQVVHLKKDGKGMLDLTTLNRQQLLKSGLQEKHIFTVGLCTYCHSDLFTSYRRDGKSTAGMLSGIMRAV